MRLFNDNQRQKHATALLCVLLLAVMTFSSVFILLEHDHDCSGADCPVCLAIHQAKKNMTCLGLGEGNMTASVPSQVPSLQQLLSLRKSRHCNNIVSTRPFRPLFPRRLSF